MGKSLRVELTDDQRRDLRGLLARCDLTAYTRQRAECIRFLDRGRTTAEVADLLECHPVTVRAAVHRFEEGGIAGLLDASRPGRPAKLLGPEDRAALTELLDDSAVKGVTWTASALRDWLFAERGVEISVDWLSELLHRDGFRWKRTRDSVRHKADPVLQQAAKAELGDLRTYGWRRTRANAT
ncbi:helix-turn-helix domain-containing protein [Streptomyces fractus]|uniref:helix-turn-helix domain-containing protein n=1 Tax=Streptomyces fractus TaxID=641806 RepID=UPI003CEEDF81